MLYKLNVELYFTITELLKYFYSNNSKIILLTTNLIRENILILLIKIFMHKLSKAEVIKLPGSLVAHIVKNLPAMQESLVQFLGQDDHLEKGQVIYSYHLTL